MIDNDILWKITKKNSSKMVYLAKSTTFVGEEILNIGIIMILNTTYLVGNEIEQRFLNWLRSTYVPEALETNLVFDARLMKVLTSEEEGVSYSLQFSSKNVHDLNSFKKGFFSQKELAIREQFGERVLYFSTILKPCEL